MTFVPHGPLWCWGLQGADVVYLSQPTHTWNAGTYVRFPLTTAAQRCQAVSWLQEQDGGYRTPLIQCGCMAGPLPDGTALCDVHRGTDGTCAWCDTLAQAGETKACPGCHATWRAIGIACWCCDAGDA